MKLTHNYKLILAVTFILGCACVLNGLADDVKIPSEEKFAHRDTVDFSNVFAEARDIRSVRSLLIQQHGDLVAEKYFRGSSRDRKMNTKSASKSIISLLAGIAIDKGYIKSVEDLLHRYLPEYFEDIKEPAKRAITIKDLLTMRTGLETTSFYNYGAWVTSDNWVKYALEQPMVAEPGGDMVYSTGTSHLLSVIIARASGMSTRAFARKYLFGPMDIEPGGWDRDPQGNYMGGNNLALTPKDLLKIGQMVLNGGTWDGKRIVSQEWIVDSFQTYTRSNFNPYDYGYMWWNRPVAGYTTFFAWGYGGQYLFIIPELDAVVVVMSSLADATQQRRYKEPVFQLVRETIIPDVLEEDANGRGAVTGKGEHHP